MEFFGKATAQKMIRAFVASIVTTAFIQAVGAIFFAYDVKFNMDASQTAAVESMPYAAAVKFLETHSTPASIWERLAHAFDWRFLSPEFFLVLIAIFLSSLALQYWPTERKS